MKAFITLIALAAYTATISAFTSAEPCAPNGNDCSSCGYGFVFCSGNVDGACYNPDLGEVCCADGCVCPSGMQCPTTESQCVPIDLPTITLTSTSFNTLTSTSYEGGTTKTLTLIPAGTSSPATSAPTTVDSTSLPCQESPGGVGTSSVETNTPLPPDNTTQPTSSSTTTVVQTPAATSFSEGYPGQGSSPPTTASPPTSVSGVSTHGGNSTGQGHSTSDNAPPATYTGTNNSSGKSMPASIFAYMIAVAGMVLF